MKRVNVCIVYLIVSILLISCSAPNSSNNVRNEEYIKKTFIDGISYTIPESWDNTDYFSSSQSIVEIGYFPALTSELKATMNNPYFKYDVEAVTEGIIFWYRDPSDGLNKTLDDSYEILLSQCEEGGGEYKKIKLDGAKGLYTSGIYDNQNMYLIPLKDGAYFFVIVIKDENAITRYSAEIEKIVDSIKIEQSLKKQ